MIFAERLYRETAEEWARRATKEELKSVLSELKKWRDELISTKEPQARGQLVNIISRDKETGEPTLGYCCLGIRCLQLGMSPVFRGEDSYSYDPYRFRGNDSPTVLSETEARKLFGTPELMACFASLNDDYHIPFTGIAMVVEELIELYDLWERE